MYKNRPIYQIVNENHIGQRKCARSFQRQEFRISGTRTDQEYPTAAFVAILTCQLHENCS